MMFSLLVLACQSQGVAGSTSVSTAPEPGPPGTPMDGPSGVGPAPAAGGVPVANGRGGTLAAVGARPVESAGVVAGGCEPSALVPFGGNWVVGDNEDSRNLYVFNSLLEPQPTRLLPTNIEDIEALAPMGDALVVVGSHSRNKKGEVKADRSRILVQGEASGDRMVPLDVSMCAECATSQALAPSEGGFNIEGAVVIGDHLALGLRSPLSGTRARLLMAPLTGPNIGKVDGMRTFDFGGEGFREIIPWKRGYLAVSGPVADGGPHHLWYISALELDPVRVGGELPAGTESILPLSDSELLVLIDGDGKPGKCETSGSFLVISMALP